MQHIIRKALIWLRNDLRLEDHYAFHNAANKCERVVAYYAFDPKQFIDSPWGFKKTGKFRVQFLIETLEQLKEDLAKKNISIIIECECPEIGIPKWIDSLGITDIYYQKEWTREEQNVSNTLRTKLSDEVLIHPFYDQFLFHPEDIPIKVENLPEVFTVFRKQCEKSCKVRYCYPEISSFPKENILNQDFKVPALTHHGFENIKPHPNTAFPFKGGSKAGRDRLNKYFWETQKLSYYKQTRNGLIGKDYSSKLSAWLANGSLSARQIYWEVMKYEKEIRKNQSTYWMIFELIWRDYFKFISLKHRDKIFQLAGILNKKYDWLTDKNKLNSWINGNTSEPFVNANMIEIKKTGWMSNRGRQNVASFFAKDLLMDWRMGAAYFESMLIDYDVHSNYGNWMYVSGVGNDPRDRKFNIRMQAERYDHGGKFQRMWNQKSLFE